MVKVKERIPKAIAPIKAILLKIASFFFWRWKRCAPPEIAPKPAPFGVWNTIEAIVITQTIS